ncbi:MAG: IS3 family transposase [Bacteroidales bacterium]
MRRAYERSRQRYGSPRIHRDLRDEDVRYATTAQFTCPTKWIRFGAPSAGSNR